MIVNIKSLTTTPVDVNNLAIVTLNGTALLTWDLATDLDVKENGSVLFRYSQSGDVWENSIKLQTSASGQSTSVTLPLLIGTYSAKFADSAGNQSVNASSVIVTTIPNIFHMNTVAFFHQNPSFIGVKTNMVVVSDKLQLDVNGGGDLYQFGSYEFDYDIDIKAVQTAKVTVKITSNAINFDDFIDDPIDPIDNLEIFDNPPANVVIETFISTTDDDPLGSPTWSPWTLFTISDYTARAFKFKLEVSADFKHQIQISEISVSVELPDRSELGRAIVSGITTKTVLYALPFGGGLIESPVVGITPANMMTGDYFLLSNETYLGFDINFYNSSDNAISRVFNYNSTGY